MRPRETLHESRHMLILGLISTPDPSRMCDRARVSSLTLTRPATIRPRSRKSRWSC